MQQIKEISLKVHGDYKHTKWPVIFRYFIYVSSAHLIQLLYCILRVGYNWLCLVDFGEIISPFVSPYLNNNLIYYVNKLIHCSDNSFKIPFVMSFLSFCLNFYLMSSLYFFFFWKIYGPAKLLHQTCFIDMSRWESTW